MSKPSKLYMKTPDARNPHGLTCESILRRLEVDAMNGKKVSIERWSDYAPARANVKKDDIESQVQMHPESGIFGLGHSHTETTGARHSQSSRLPQPVFYSDDGHILMGPYHYARTTPTDDGRVRFAGAQDLWDNEFSNSAMTMRLYSWDSLIDDYNKNGRQLSVRFKTQAHNSKDPADYTDRLWDLNNLYVAHINFSGNEIADKQMELCGYEWKA